MHMINKHEKQWQCSTCKWQFCQLVWNALTLAPGHPYCWTPAIIPVLLLKAQVCNLIESILSQEDPDSLQ